MGRHMDTYEAKLNPDRQVTIDGEGKIRIAMKLVSGKRGGPIVLPVTLQALEALAKQAQEALRHHAVEQVKMEYGRREWASKLKVQELERSNRQKDQQNAELTRQLDRVHDIVRPDRSDGVALPGQPVLPVSPAGVTH